MFEAGSIVYRIQAVGTDVFKRDLLETDQAAQKTGRALTGTADATGELAKKAAETAPRVRTVRDEITGMSLAAQQASTTVGRSMVVVGAAVVAVSGLAVKAAIDWQSAWTGVTKTIDATPEQLQEIEGGLRDLTKVLPASHDEIAAVAEAAGQLGVRAEDIVGFTKTMVDLGETTNLSADEAATSLAQLMNIFQTAPDDVDNLGAAIVALGNNGASTERDIVQMSQRIAGAAKIIGLSEGETLGLANALASVGIEAEAGGSSVSNIMIDIANAVSTKGSKLLKWAELAGLSADEFAEKYRTKPAEALALVIEGMGRLNDSGGDVFRTLSDLGQTDVRVTRSLLGLASSGDLLRKSLELGNKAWDENTALQIEAEKRYATTAAKLEMARNSINDAAIDLGGNLLPAVEAVSGAVGDFADVVGSVPPELQGGLAVFALFTAGILLAGGTALLAVPKLVAFRVAVRTLATEMPVATAGVKGFAGMLGGPLGVALTVATAGVMALNDWAQSLRASSGELTASMQTQSRTAETMFATFAKGAGGLSNAAVPFERIQEAINAVDDSNNPFALFLDSDLNRVFSTLRNIGDELGDLAKTDLPSAQKSFRDFVKQTDGTEESQWRLLNAFKGYKDVVIASATANGTYTETMSEAQKKQAILAEAQGTTSEKTTEATDAILAQKAALDEWLKAVGESDAKFVSLQDGYDAIVQGNVDAAQATADNTESSQDAWQDYYDGFTIGVDQFLADLQRQVDAQTNWEANMILLSGRVSQGVIDELAAMGPEGAALVAQLVTASDDQLALMEGLFAQRSSAATGAFATTLAEAGPVIAAAAGQLGQDAANEIAAKLAAGTTTVEAVIQDYKLIVESTKPRILVDTEDATGKVWSLINLLGRVPTSQTVGYGTVLAPYAQALGGINFVTPMAAGGIRSNAGVMPQIRRAGDVTVWAEHETGGESYIPWANDHRRPKAVEILDRTAYELGYDIVPRNARAMAEGGSSTTELSLTSSTSAPSAPSPTVLAKTSIEELARAFAAQLRLQSKQGGKTNG